MPDKQPQQPSTIKLYNLKRGSKILLPIGKVGETGAMELCTFHRLDGAYSVIETPKGNIVHLSASAPLKQVGEHWELA
jgi:hypothetical protein